MKRRKWMGLCLLAAVILFAGLWLWRNYRREQTLVTPAALKEKYKNTDRGIALENTIYGVSKKQKFQYDFACDFSEFPVSVQEKLITVHTDRACREESRIITGFEIEKRENGSKITVYPIEQAMQTKSDRKKDTGWGSAPVYYIAIRFDRETKEARKLDKPCVIPFTLKTDSAVPRLSAEIGEDGVFRLVWSPVEGASEYRVYNYVTSEILSGGGNAETEGARYGYKNGYLSYEGSTKETMFEGFSGGKKNEVLSTSHKNGKSFVIGENYNVQGEYYVTSVTNGKESVLSNAVGTSDLRLPREVKEDSDILYNRYQKVEELPLSVPVENIDGSVQERQVLYTFSEEIGVWGKKQPHYWYRIEGTGLTGYVVMEGDSGEHYPETVGAPSLNGGIVPEDRTNKVPQVQPKEGRGGEETVPSLESDYYIQADSAAEEWLALNLIAGREKIYIGDFPELTEPDGLRSIFYQVYYQNPYIFGIEAFDCDYSTMTLEVAYLYSQRERERMRWEMIKAAEAVVKAEGILSLGEEERMKRLYDWLAGHCTYDREAFSKTRETSFRKSGADTYEYAHNAYGALVLGKGMCQAYTDAFLLLCHISGIEAAAVSGYMNQSLPHVWNMVRLGNEWYHIDVTNNKDTTGVPYYLFLAGERCAGELQYVTDGRAAGGTRREIGLAEDETKEYYASHGLVIQTAGDYLPLVETALKGNKEIPVVRRGSGVSEKDLVNGIRQVYTRSGKQNELENHTWQSVGKYFLVK